ncbi:hypothetical protein I6M49_22175 [Shewanella algae]|uniref:hypothetical protein n=1 Tax=Shewanella algae TaxID=38313 RepID=UPI001AAD1403|nr:hypothetical protein [Shewanella algae]MBO2656153.1 hypothetical protein [Shewanella algae]
MENTIALPRYESTAVGLNFKIFAVVALFVVGLLLSIDATAGTGGAAFTSIWTEISGWADGVPGKIITLLAFFASLFNVLKQNYYLAVGAFLGGMLLSQSVQIINIFLTGTI